MTSHQFGVRIKRFPRISLIHRPTPFRKLEKLTAELGGPQIYVKREDLTGLAFGGNKSRKLEFIIPDVLKKKADVIITWASLQSNWCLQTAAAARVFGIHPILILHRTSARPVEYEGNLLLDYILGAEIRMREAEAGKIVITADALAAAEEVADEVRRAGRKPYVVSVGGSLPLGSMKLPLGAISYADAFREAYEQIQEIGFSPDYIVHSSGSGATQAGLVVGARALSEKTKIIGISVSDPKLPFAKNVLAIAQATEKALGLPTRVRAEDVVVFDEYIKDGYGFVNREVAEIIRFVFTREGIVLDPVYTSKAFIGLVDLIKKGFFGRRDKVVFFHTGGTPALFAHQRRMVDLLK
jgi:L-cysteate sulfo-lyase